MEILDTTKEENTSCVIARLPIVVSFDDYHEIQPFAELLTDLTENGVRVKGEEVGFQDGQYIGIFYRLKRESDFYALKKKWSANEAEED